MTDSSSPLIGLILAGGRARRMGGGDKCLLPLAGRSLLDRTLEKARPQVDQLLLNANGHHLRFARRGMTVLADEFPDYRGPLAGVHAGLGWLETQGPEAQWLVSFASDSPFFPTDLVARLAERAAETDAELAVASSGGHLHPIFALWHRSLRPAIESALASEVSPPLREWVQTRNWVEVPFDVVDYDPFFNINRPQDLYQAEALLPAVEGA